MEGEWKMKVDSGCGCKAGKIGAGIKRQARIESIRVTQKEYAFSDFANLLPHNLNLTLSHILTVMFAWAPAQSKHCQRHLLAERKRDGERTRGKEGGRLGFDPVARQPFHSLA